MCEGDLNKLSALKSLSILEYHDYIEMANLKAKKDESEIKKRKRGN